MDGGTWWVTVAGVTKSWTRLSNFTFSNFNVHRSHRGSFENVDYDSFGLGRGHRDTSFNKFPGNTNAFVWVPHLEKQELEQQFSSFRSAGIPCRACEITERWIPPQGFFLYFFKIVVYFWL